MSDPQIATNAPYAQAVRRTPSGGYAQVWPAYNRAQTHEKDEFQILLAELCRGVEEPDQVTGRPRVPWRDMVFAAAFRFYCALPARRFTCDLKAARDKGLISRLPAYNTVLAFLACEQLTPCLRRLITESSSPLRTVEAYFAVDSTGLSTCHRREWYDRHRGRLRRKREWVKLHVITGVNTNAIACAEVSAGSANDSPFFKGLVRNAARHFEVAEVSADAGYLAADNMREALLAGAIPYIAFRSNSTSDWRPKSTFWKRMLALYKERSPEFTEHYNRRNNVETTFYMLKEKFGERLRGRGFTAQVNEALCKVLCHNLCVVIQSMHELGIAPTFWSESEEQADATEGSKRGVGSPDRLAAALALCPGQPTEVKDAGRSDSQRDGHLVGENLPLFASRAPDESAQIHHDERESAHQNKEASNTAGRCPHTAGRCAEQLKMF